jgi:PhnB protein
MSGQAAHFRHRTGRAQLKSRSSGEASRACGQRSLPVGHTRVRFQGRGLRVVLSPGFDSVTTRMIVNADAAQVGFLRAVFDASGDVHPERPAEIRVGNGIILVSRASEREAFPAFQYVYVDDADIVYQRALAAGAISMEAPRDMPYGDRRATVRDTWGNIFQGGVNRFSWYTLLKPSSLRRSISRIPWSWSRDQKAPKLRPAVRARRREGCGPCMVDARIDRPMSFIAVRVGAARRVWRALVSAPAD